MISDSRVTSFSIPDGYDRRAAIFENCMEK
jgi:hypothetical protein